MFFTHVCHFVHGGGGVGSLLQRLLGYTLPRQRTPPPPRKLMTATGMYCCLIPVFKTASKFLLTFLSCSNGNKSVMRYPHKYIFKFVYSMSLAKPGTTV